MARTPQEELAALADTEARLWKLDAEQTALYRETVAASAHDLLGSDGWYWLGPRSVGHYLEDLAERIADGERPRSFLDYEEARADAAC